MPRPKSRQKNPQLILNAAKRVPQHWIEPDAFLRYWPVIRWLCARSKLLKVLEVGSGDFGLSTYLDYPLVKTDVNFVSKKSGAKNKVSANALALPFQDKYFDLVFGVDLFEHIFPEQRKSVFREMLRVARERVVLIFPCGEEARDQDFRLAEIYRAKSGQTLSILEEHRKIPFPSEIEIKSWLGGRPVKKWRIQNSFHLNWRKYLINGWLQQKKWAIVLAELILSFPSASRFLHFGNCYRRILTIDV